MFIADLQYEWHPYDGLICFKNKQAICTKNFFYPVVTDIKKIQIIINLQNYSLSFKNNDCDLGVATYLLSKQDYGIFVQFSQGTIKLQDVNIVQGN